MPLEKQFNTFIKGIITEANALTFPANASLDEDNFILNRDGSRNRRLGIDFESGFTLIDTNLSIDTIQRSNAGFYRWDSPGGDSTVTIGIVRLYNRLWFINLATANPSSNTFNYGAGIVIEGLGNNDMDIAFINNQAVIVSSGIQETVLLTYEPTSQLIYQESIPLFMRDLVGVDDGLSPSERPTTLTATHNYNLINQGWSTQIPVPDVYKVESTNPLPKPQFSSGLTSSAIFNNAQGTNPSLSNYIMQLNTWSRSTVKTTPTGGTAIGYTFAVLGFYPSNSDIWTLGKNSDASDDEGFQKYDPNILIKNSLSNVVAPKGAAILDIYNRGSSRRNSTGLQTLPLDKENGRCSTVASYAGRVFYSGVASNVTEADIFSPNYNNYIFFSQIVTNKQNMSNCYQEADPTSPDISDIVDTDGGTIQIPEASSIVKLIPALGSLIVLAENGIWEIYGDSGGFTATSYQASKISSTGVKNKNSVVEVNGNVFAWGEAGILLIASDTVTGRFKVENVSLTSIQTLYNAIPNLAKQKAKVTYNDKDNTIRWLYNDTEDYSIATGAYKYNRELILDLNLKAFYTHTISYSTNPDLPHVVDYINIPSSEVVFVDDNVIVGDDEVLIDTLEEVSILSPDYITQQSKFKFLTVRGNFFSLSQYSDTTFHDWASIPYFNLNYDSYLVTGYEISQDLMREKQVPYIFTYLKKTEEGFDENLEFIRPSGCLLQAQWNWHNSASGNKWGTPFQVYRHKRQYVPSGSDDTFDNGETIIVSKSKLRGSGKSVSLKFSSEEGKDCHIIGWAYPMTGDKVV